MSPPTLISTLHVALLLPTKLDQETNHGVPGTGGYVIHSGASSEVSARNQGGTMIKTFGRLVGGMQKQAQAVAHPRPCRLRVKAWLGAGVVGGVALGFLLAPKAGAHRHHNLAKWMSGKAEEGVERQVEAMENEGGHASPASDGQDHRPPHQRV